MKRSTSMLMAIALLFCVGQANASLVITFAQSGADVVATGTGSLNFLDLSFQGFDINNSYVNAGARSGNDRLVRPVCRLFRQYPRVPRRSARASTSSPHSSTSTAPGSTGAGVFGSTGQLLYPAVTLPVTRSRSSATWNNTTISGLGQPPARTFGPGDLQMRDNLTVIIPGSAVPEPSSLILLGSGALGLIGVVRRKILGVIDFTYYWPPLRGGFFYDWPGAPVLPLLG